MYPEIEELDEIIEQMDNLELNEKIQLKAVFKGLNNRQEELFENIKERIVKETKHTKEEFQKIYIMLVDSEMKKIVRENNFYEVCEDVQPLKSEKIKIENTEIKEYRGYSCGIVFWNRQYEALNEILTQRYNADIDINGEIMQTEYYFEECNEFIDKEKEIHKLSRQYGAMKPVIYNPMARRALKIFVKLPKEISRTDKVVVDFEFEKNGLKSGILLDKYLLWNISEKNYEDLPPVKEGTFEEIVPLWDKTFVVYKFQLKQNQENYTEYILVNNDIRAIKIVDNAVYWQLKQNDYSEMMYKKFTIYKVDTKMLDGIREKNFYIYCNYYQSPALGEIERIRTKSDVERCVNCFNELEITCLGADTKNEFTQNQLIYTYTNRKDYYQIKDERLRAASVCKICFERDDEDMLFVDKLSYILGYLNYRYPEYQWIGVC